MLLTGGCANPGGLKVGDQLFRRDWIYDENRVLTDSTVSASLKAPDGTITPASPVHEATGTYLTGFGPFTLAGIYHWFVEAGGPVFAVKSGHFRVAPLGF
jgi:hypothetical protein